MITIRGVVMRKTKKRKYKLRPEVGKAGFGAANFFVTIVFIIASYGVFTDIMRVVEDIEMRKSIYESLYSKRNELMKEMSDLRLVYERLDNDDYLEMYAVGSMWLTRPGENLFVIRDNR